MQYKGAHKPLPDIAKELGVDGVIEGSVERAGDQVRITAQLINARTDTHLWARSYQRDLKNVLALQSDVAQAIAHEVQVQLTPHEQARLQQSREVNPQAYEAYLQGRYHYNFHTGPELQMAIAEYEKAIKLDPTYAVAYVGLAETYQLLPFNGDARPKDVLPRAKEAGLKAVELDPDVAEAHSSLAVILAQWDWDWAGAEREFKAAIAKNPNSAHARMFYGNALTFMGRHEEGIAEGRRARELDPLSPLASFILGMDYHLARRYDAAVQEYQYVLQLNPKFWPASLFLGEVYEQQGKYPEALAELEKAQGPTLEARTAIAHVYALSGRRTEAEKIIQEFTQRAKDHYVPGTYFAKIYAGLGDRDQAFVWLDKAYAERESRLEFVKTDPSYDSLHLDPRFQELMRRLDMPD
jgi:tetratricopeptide (TPR) repeat protein